MHILNKIVAQKHIEVSNRKITTPISVLERSDFFETICVSMSSSIRESKAGGIIAEFKRKSPSKPTINLDALVEDVCLPYFEGGAAAMSILTDASFFGGSELDLSKAKGLNCGPLLRKEFIVDEYQVIEAKSIGADAILLISEILTKAEIKILSQLAHNLGLQVLLEVHSENHLSKLSYDVDMVGVNNRDLTEFSVNPKHSIKLFPSLPKELVKISESGIHNIEVIQELMQVGFDGFLIGERFMATDNPGLACAEFITSLKDRLS